MNQVAVASPLRSATEAGLAAGLRGGNALDAALATAAVLTVAYPASCAIGGDLLALVRDPDGSVTFVNASGRALRATDPDAVRAQHSAIPAHGPLPITVPGMVGGWDALWRHGAALPWRDVIAPAVTAAADGVAVSPGLAGSIAEVAPLLPDFPGLAGVLAAEGQPLSTGELLRQPALARTLTAIAESGARTMYDGAVAEALIKGLNALDVPIAADDLSTFTVEQSPALHADVGDWRVFAGRPNSQAYMVPRLLGMLNRVGDESRPLHRRVEAARLAIAFFLAQRERDSVLADPDFMTGDVTSLLTDDALADFADVVVNHSLTSLDGSPEVRHPTGDTVAVVAADAEGRSVSLIQSLFNGFGSLVLEPTTGVLMHDRGACFVLDPTSPNVLAPGKRPMHTLSPVLAERLDGRELLAVGTMGGHHQPQILTQVFSHLFDGATAQEAVGRPRMTVSAWEDWETHDTVSWESDIDPAVSAELGAFPGTPVEVAPHNSRMGHAHAIRVRADTWEPDVGTDPRADGLG